VWKWRKAKSVPEEKRIVLGLQQAAAWEANLEHAKSFPGLVSALEGVSYLSDPLSPSLLRLVPSNVDRLVEKVAKRFRESDEESRFAIRKSLTEADFGTIGLYAQRQAARLLLTRNPDDAAPALDAVAMITKARIDSRTVRWRLSNLRLALSKISNDETADRFFNYAAAIAEPQTSLDFLAFSGLSFDEVSRTSRLSIVEFENRLVLLERGSGRYEPTLNLLGAAEQIADLLLADGYGYRDPVVGDPLGYRWLEESVGAQTIYNKSLASVRIGMLIRDDYANDELPIFLVSVFELATLEEGRAFETSWATGKRSFASLVVGRGRVLALFIASTVLPGAKPTETDRTLKRFSIGTAEILENLSSGSR
jgi:hypothetical protein